MRHGTDGEQNSTTLQQQQKPSSAAGQDYEVQLVPLITMDGMAVPQRKATVRSDNGAVLGQTPEEQSRPALRPGESQIKYTQEGSNL